MGPNQYVYVLHFQHEDGRIEHYVGHTYRTARTRFKEHAKGYGSPRTSKLVADGFVPQIAYYYPGTLLDESFLIAWQKQDKLNAGCVLCGGHARYIPGIGASTKERVEQERHNAAVYLGIKRRKRRIKW